MPRSTPGLQKQNDPQFPALRFDRFELRPHERTLLVDGKPTVLGSRAMDVLEVLIERAGQLVTKHQLMDLVWPGAVVEEGNLASQIWALRKVIGPQIIATIPGRGYRFASQVENTFRADEPVALSVASAPGAPSSKLRSNLPPTLTALLGREHDLAAIGALIDRQRMVTIVGPGGVGKTSLAQHLLSARRLGFPHGICWVELAGVDDASALPGAIAAALGLSIGGGEPLGALCAAVAPLGVMIALDNAEQVLAGTALVAEALHAAAPALRLLATSQSPLKIPCEHVYRLPPLQVPKATVPVAQALRFGAVALFVERAQASDSRFTLTDANVAAVTDLCRTLDGLPLAIELAASRAPMLGVHKLAALMDERLKLLTFNSNRWAPARHQSLHAALERSYGFLNEREQTVFRRMGVLSGTGSLEIVQALVADPGGVGDENVWVALDALGSLVDRSLVVVVEGDDAAAPPRYRLLESPRAHALQRLRDAGEIDTLRDRHAATMAIHCDLAWVERWSGHIRVNDWYGALYPELDNLRDGFGWARSRGDAATALRIARTLLYALPQSLHADGIALANLCEPLLEHSLPAQLRIEALLSMTYSWIDTHSVRSKAAMAQAAPLARLQARTQGPDRDPFWLYAVRHFQVNLFSREGDAVAAKSALTELRACEDRAWPPQRRYAGAAAEFVFARNFGDHATALAHLRREIALLRAAGQSTSTAQSNLIDAEIAAGEPRAALKTGIAVVTQLKGGRDEQSLSFAYLNLLAASLAIDDTAGARDIVLAGWTKACRFAQQPYWCDYLALLAAVEQRPCSAVRIAAYADQGYDRLQNVRQPNERSAMERVDTLVRSALDTAEIERVRSGATALNDDDIAVLAVALEDSVAWGPVQDDFDDLRRRTPAPVWPQTERRRVQRA